MLFRAVEQLDTASPPDSPPSAASWYARVPQLITLRRLGIVCLVIVACRVAAVDIAGVVTNDSLGYLGRADAPFAHGFVTQGYRQAAYPLLVAISNVVGDLLGWDHIFGVALIQRALLVTALGVVIWALRWWSAPVVLVATSSSFVVHADFVLPEGTLVPACLLLGGLLATAVTGRVPTARAAKIVLIGAAATVALCASIKLQFAAMLIVAAAAAWLVVVMGHASRRFAVTVLASTAMFIGLLATAQAFENRSELGAFEPVSERARAEWYGAWQAVFGVDKENRSVPQLAEFYDDGNLYRFQHSVDGVPQYRTRVRIIRDRIELMFEAAGTSSRAEQIAAFFGALRAGRTDDLGDIVDRILDAPDGDSTIRISFNQDFRRDGTGTGLIEELNDGRRPGVVTTGPLIDVTQRVLPDHREYRSVLAVVAIALMLLSLPIAGRHRVAVASVLGSVAIIALALGTAYIDNARYLLGPLALAMVGCTLAARALFGHARDRIRQHR